jgi:methylenetetrahydrofolate dehydrogenase (NADP+)/methenyltetrahydrofolate cyclohydrolase
MILDGAAIAKRLKAALVPRVLRVTRRLGRAPGLALVACRAETAAEFYFSRELKACREAGIAAREERVDPRRGQAALERRLAALSRDRRIDGILLEFPLPPKFDAQRVLAALAPAKDVEGLTPENQGRLFGSKHLDELERSGAFVPCTALALLRLLKASGAKTAGAHAVVIGRSRVAGRPAAHLLSCLDATVTLAHSRSRNLAALTKTADILVSAAGRPGLIKGAMLKQGVVVLDAGTTWKGGKLLGDADFRSASKQAAAITPVPGGVGPVTVAELLNAVVTAAERRAKG